MVIYNAKFSENHSSVDNLYILTQAEGSTADSSASTVSPEFVDELITAASMWHADARDAILVFDQQRWRHDTELFKAVKSASWDDVILEKDTKDALIYDVETFFDCEDEYKRYVVPWKRGIIIHGTPGNGKTISIKALMHSLATLKDPIPSLYVKSLAGCNNAFHAIRQIFTTARQYSPCLLIFEDLDSLIDDKVKSFFLNEVDGLEDNNGLMMLGSTNYLERLDAGISKRPGRFDRVSELLSSFLLKFGSVAIHEKGLTVVNCTEISFRIASHSPARGVLRLLAPQADQQRQRSHTAGGSQSTNRRDHRGLFIRIHQRSLRHVPTDYCGRALRQAQLHHGRLGGSQW